jgi:hypothetical protein
MNGDNRHTGLIHDFRGNGFSFSPISMMLAIGLSYTDLQCLGTFLLLVFLKLYHEMVLSLIKVFFCIFWDDQVDFVFASINVLYYIYRFAYVEPVVHPWDEANVVMVYNLFNVVGFGLTLFYWGFLHWCSLGRLAYSSPFSRYLCLVLRWA